MMKQKNSKLSTAYKQKKTALGKNEDPRKLKMFKAHKDMVNTQLKMDDIAKRNVGGKYSGAYNSGPLSETSSGSSETKVKCKAPRKRFSAKSSKTSTLKSVTNLKHTYVSGLMSNLKTVGATHTKTPILKPSQIGYALSSSQKASVSNTAPAQTAPHYNLNRSNHNLYYTDFSKIPPHTNHRGFPIYVGNPIVSNRTDPLVQMMPVKPNINSFRPQNILEKSGTLMGQNNAGHVAKSNLGAFNLPTIISLNNLLKTETNPYSDVINSNTAAFRHMSETEILSILRRTVDKAISDKKTFTVLGNYYTIRRGLLQRGWIEKLRFNYNLQDRNNLRLLDARSINELLPLASHAQHGYHARCVIMSKLMGSHQVDFYWDQSYDAYRINPDDTKYTLINSIKRGMLSYASKQGLCEAMKRAHWYQKPGTSYIRHPRSYSLTNSGDPDQFISDFKTSAAMSLLKWIVDTNVTHSGRLISVTGKIPMSCFHFALNECAKFIKKCTHEDIDNPVDEAEDYEWNEFLENYYKIVHIGNHFQQSQFETEETMLHKTNMMIKSLKKYWPYFQMDGYMNIWILKPVRGSRGVGIHICRTLQYVLKVITENKNSRYVIQKYIEKPLLIFNTKFDIRQWFLISSTLPLTIWMWKVCYLRFSSQTYNLKKLHESIHLTNNSIQCRYKNANRNGNLPDFNMWDSIEFEKYLESMGYPNSYKNIIYPGMRQCVVAAVLLNQEGICTRKNSFELYGADFMLTEDFKPWLIEINSRPALYPSTPVTARLCPQVLEDVIKVVVDNARNPTAPTGNFELIYKQKIPPLPLCDADSLKLEGKPLSGSFFCNPGEAKDTKVSSDHVKEKSKQNQQPNKKISSIEVRPSNDYTQYIRNEMKMTLEKLINLIKTERDRKKNLKNFSHKENQKDMDRCVSNIDKGVECVLEMKQLLKEKNKCNTSSSYTQINDKLLLSNTITHKQLKDEKQEAEEVKEMLVQITENSCSSTSLFHNVLKLLGNKDGN